MDTQWKLSAEGEKMGRLLQGTQVDEAQVLEEVDRILALEREIKRGADLVDGADQEHTDAGAAGETGGDQGPNRKPARRQVVIRPSPVGSLQP